MHYAASLDDYTTSSGPDSNDHNASKVSLLRESATPSPTDGGKSSSLQLDVDVRVSAGRYTVRGQYLSWIYPIPATGEAVYTIEIKRAGGGLRRDTGWVQQQGGWWEVCPSCTIA